MATLCLPDASLHVGVDFDQAPILDAILADGAREAVLLYPGRAARATVADPPAPPGVIPTITMFSLSVSAENGAA